MLLGMPKSKKRASSKRRPTVPPRRVRGFVDELFGDDLHAKRVESLANATVGTLESARLSIHAIGRGLAAVEGLVDKHAVKQVDRLIGNEGVDPVELQLVWARRAVSGSDELLVNIDWTEFERDGHSMLVLSLQTSHGRALPLLWQTYSKKALKGNQSRYENELLLRLRDVVEPGVRVVVIGDRGFEDHALFGWLEEELNFDFIIRVRAAVIVTNDQGERRPAGEWVGKGGRMRRLTNARVTTKEKSVGQVVVVQDKGMEDIWCLVASDARFTGSWVKQRYGKRFSCEETFRDIKDLRFGMGMKWNRVRKPERRDRLMLLAVLAQALLTLLGQAGELVGLDRLLKTNTSKKRTMSLLRQGLRWYQLLPNMPAQRERKLMAALDELVRADTAANSILAAYAAA
jgi:hypothetical protein